VPDRRQQKARRTPTSPDPAAALPLSGAALKVEKILSRGHHVEQQHIHRYKPLRKTADGYGMVEACKCNAYRVVYPER
jgi:hypothetical protein